MKNRLLCEFDIELMTTDLIYLVDLYNDDSPTMSITNNAEAVIEYLAENFSYLKDTRVFYKDTEGRVDELCHDGKWFTGFKPGYHNETDFLNSKIGLER